MITELALLVGLSPSLFVEAQGDSFKLKVIHMSDHHAHLSEDILSIKTEKLPPEITTTINITEVDLVQVTYGGFPRLMTLLQGMEKASTADATLKIHGGDVFSGTLFYTLFAGYADMKLMTPMCFDVMTLGNHDFDDGNVDLENFLVNLTESTTDVCESATQVVSANIVPPENTTLASILLPYVIKDYDGQEVAIIGLTMKDTANVASPDEGTQFLDELTVLQDTVSELEAMGINKIIAITHVGYDVDITTVSSVKGIDVIIGAHSHTLLDRNATDFIEDITVIPIEAHSLGELLPVSGEYPTMSNDVCIVSAWCYAYGLGELDIVFDDAGVVKSCNGSMKIPYDSLVYEPLESLDEAFISGLNAYFDGISAMVPTIPDSDTASLLEEFQAQVDAFGSTVIAYVPEGICHVRIPGEEGRSKICTPEETKDQGGGVCNLIAKAYLDEIPNAEVVILNAGGCRVDINQGDYTVDDATTLLPFSDSLWALEVTGAEIIQVLNDAAKNALFRDSTGAYPYASGLRYLVDANNMDTPVSCVEVNTRLESDWTAIDEGAMYTVITGTFIASGKDGYDVFGTLSEDKKVDLGVIDAPTFVLYSQEEGTLTAPPLDEWSTQKFTAKGGTDFYTCASGAEAGVGDETEDEAGVEDETEAETEVGGETTEPAGTTAPAASSSSMVVSIIPLLVCVFILSLEKW